jgi:hypothetical protein
MLTTGLRRGRADDMADISVEKFWPGGAVALILSGLAWSGPDIGEKRKSFMNGCI